MIYLVPFLAGFFLSFALFRSETREVEVEGDEWREKYFELEGRFRALTRQLSEAPQARAFRAEEALINLRRSLEGRVDLASGELDSLRGEIDRALRRD